MGGHFRDSESTTKITVYAHVHLILISYYSMHIVLQHKFISLLTLSCKACKGMKQNNYRIYSLHLANIFDLASLALVGTEATPYND